MATAIHSKANVRSCHVKQPQKCNQPSHKSLASHVTQRKTNKFFTAARMKVLFLALALLLGTAAVASSQAKNKLRRMNQDATEPIRSAWVRNKEGQDNAVDVNDVYRRVSSIAHRRFPRILQEPACLDSALDAFFNQSLGPSLAPGSLYNSVYFESDVIPSKYRQVYIEALAYFLLEYKYLVSNETFLQEDQYFGRNGEYTQEILSQHKLIVKFWKMEDEPPLILLGEHSEPLQEGNNTEKALFRYSRYLAEVLNITASDITDEEIVNISESVRTAIEREVPNGYANSALSLDWDTKYQYGIEGFENSTAVIIGDGFLDFFASLGLSEVGNDYLHAISFSYMVLSTLLDRDVVNSDNETENRQFALETDAMAAYFLAHKQGRNFDVAELLQVARVAFAFGDCEVNNDNHWGTPKQKECATLWGADEGLDMTGDPVSPQAFLDRFLQNFDLILALDPSVCTLTDNTGDSTPSNVTKSPGGSGAGSTTSRLLLASLMYAIVGAFSLW
jgi:hypothetical protein